jgi:hypothetical protein
MLKNERTNKRTNEWTNKSEGKLNIFVEKLSFQFFLSLLVYKQGYIFSKEKKKKKTYSPVC